MISKYTYKKLTWIDLESPTREEVRTVTEEYDIPSLIAEEVIEKSARAKVDVYSNVLYLILHFPTAGRGGTTDEHELDFVIGKNFIITTHYELVDPLHEFAKMFEVNSVLDKSEIGSHAGFLLFFILREMYRQLTVELESMNDGIRDIERNIFDSKAESKMVERISLMNRNFVDFKQSMRFHRETLASLEHAGKTFFGEDFSYYLGAITGEYNKVQNMLDSHREVLSDLRETNDSLLSAKTNDTIKKLTVMTFTMLPLTLITGVFTMNSDLVFIHTVKDFYIVIGAMSLTAVIMFIYFKNKKWL